MLRQRFAFDSITAEKLLETLRLSGISQAVYLSTCNRCEIYTDCNIYSAIDILAEFAGADVSGIKNHLLVFEGENAVKHLFSVACGLDSMAVGEDEILGQLKRAFAFSSEKGFTDYEFNTVFKAAVTAAKKIKTTTLLSKSSVSIATLAATMCHKFSKGKKTALIIGASGEIGNKICKNLLSFGDFEIFATVREKHIRESGIKIISYSDRYLYADCADIIISATKSPHFTITVEKLSSFIKTKKPRLLIDLSVPRDIDEKVLEIDGVNLITIDDFEEAAKLNVSIKQREIASANEIVKSEVDALLKEMYFHSSLDFLNRFDEKNTMDFMHFVYSFRNCADAETFSAFINTVKKIADRKDKS